MGMMALSCSSSGSTPAAAGNLGAASGVPTQNAWKFGVMADTQWLSTDDGQNPNTCAVGLLRPLQQAFIAQQVKFVVQVGDLADQASGNSSEAGYATTASLCEDTRALFAQGLYSAGIGFFPVSGNHDNGSPAEFVSIFPQTQTGQMNATPASVFSITNPDASQPSPTQSGSSFTQGTNFAAIGYPSDYQGLSYGFDYNNARFVLIDQFATVSGNGPDGNAYNIDTTVSLQQAWINAAYAGKPADGHIFNFSHKGIILQQHIDVQPWAFNDLMEPFISLMRLTFWGAAFVVAPYVFYQLWAFIRPALRNRERRMVVPFVLITSTMFLAGAAFAYCTAFRFLGDILFQEATHAGLRANLHIDAYLDLFLYTLLSTGIMFELPVLTCFLAKFRLVTARWLLKYWRHSTIVIMLVSAFLTPGDVIATMIFFTVILEALYFVSVAVAWVVQPKPAAGSGQA
jgi:sec-independent protein translocase protein TatC